MEDRGIWFKGSIVPVADAKINVLSPTSQFGLNVFEGIRCYWNEEQQQLYAFRLQEHFDRLLNSCKLIGFSCPYALGQLREYFLETIRFNSYRQDVAVRMTLFIDGEGSWNSVAPVEMFIAPIAKSRTDVTNLKGLSACVSSWDRIGDNCLPPRIKAGANYINGRYGHLEARRNGYDVPIFLASNGKVSEGAGACLFIVRNGQLITPSLTSSVLESITRNTILDLALEMNLRVCEREVDRTELYIADEVFLCGSAAEVTPITSIDRVPVGQGLPGELTVKMLDLYLDVVSNKSPQHGGWLTKVY
ncbi:branched-chain amino acid transaminase [Geomonas sp. Red69]|uniref:branched-chain amino acid transaminase n=1 Tax=Geomonas diazotrophica TaxID=2843197 RepID=UPI001C0FDE4E|nr:MULTISPECIES: branched-chain amino acid transaminase [Geomonas]MBU5636060.1 branched-chain amino acid transaminase [Geomonas diazotrophica]QXE85029.1 branched-chain amino acid transaminase [Geomonas nitrogeniifigens]